MSGTINWGRDHYGIAPEWERGLVFAERFESLAEVELNGGVLGSGASVSDGSATFDNTVNAKIIYNSPVNLGSEASYILKGVVFNSAQTQASFIAYGTGNKYSLALFGGDLYTQNAAGGGIGIKPFTPVVGQKYDIALTAGANGQFYINGVKLGASFSTGGMNQIVDTIGYTPSRPWPFDGTIDDILIFNKILTEDEILAYYNNTMWDYDRYCVLALPMLLRDHDADNVRTLDRSGNGNHAQWGDGSTASTFPVFSDGKYTFSYLSSKYLTLPTDILDLSSPFTVMIMFNKQSITTNRFDRIVDINPDANNGLQIILDSSVNKYGVDFKASGVTVLNDQVYDIFQPGLQSIGLTFDGISTAITYRNSNIMSSSGSVAIGKSTQYKSLIGVRTDFNIITRFDGDIFSAFIYNTALNPTQILDLQMRMEENYQLGRRGI